MRTPSVSGPAWSSMLTGVWPAKHGVTNNKFTGKRYDEFPDFLTRIEQVRPDLSTAAIAESSRPCEPARHLQARTG